MPLAVKFASTIIRAVLVCYGVWGAVLVVDLATCETRRPGRCDSQRSEIRGAATAIPATLLAWLADSPLNEGSSNRNTETRSTAIRRRDENAS